MPSIFLKFTHSLHPSFTPPIHFFLISAYSAVSIAGGLEPLPAVLGEARAVRWAGRVHLWATWRQTTTLKFAHALG